MTSRTNPVGARAKGWRRVPLGLGAAALLLCAGCNILGPALYLVSDDRESASYTLDPKRSAVVFVDDRNSVLPNRSLRDRIAKGAEQQLLDHKLLTATVVSSDSLQQIVVGERFSKPRSVAEIGKAVNADQVIYATVDSFYLSPDGSQFAPSASMRVKVIDSRTGERLFPSDKGADAGGGKEPSVTITIAEKVSAKALPKSTAEIMKQQQELADQLGLKLGQLFYKHSIRDPNSPVGR